MGVTGYILEGICFLCIPCAVLMYNYRNDHKKLLVLSLIALVLLTIVFLPLLIGNYSA